MAEVSEKRIAEATRFLGVVGVDPTGWHPLMIVEKATEIAERDRRDMASLYAEKSR